MGYKKQIFEMVARAAARGATPVSLETHAGEEQLRDFGVLVELKYPAWPVLQREELTAACLKALVELVSRLPPGTVLRPGQHYWLYRGALRTAERSLPDSVETPLSEMRLDHDGGPQGEGELLDWILLNQATVAGSLSLPDGGEIFDQVGVFAELFDLGPHYVIMLIERAVEGDVNTAGWMQALEPMTASVTKRTNWIQDAKVGAVLRFFYLLWADEIFDALQAEGRDGPLQLTTTADAARQGRACFELRYVTPGITSDHRASAEARRSLGLRHDTYARRRRAYARWFLRFLTARNAALDREFGKAFENYCDLPVHGDQP